ncbi:lytic transglycosylase domain-containing protein [Schaalia sp. ZJ1691]|uniref:lytic transglycosylase domain-containing protein n=1 Tax=Schaalia sp. ZJ1691 TaxID=2709404 RepID=UPI0013EAFE1E|nr:lytic transglycosylase domain-containing protein [Schaalia sp. ZJ1691]
MTKRFAVVSFTVLIGLLTLIIIGSSLVSAGDNDAHSVPAEYETAVLKAGSVCHEITPALIAAQVEAESGWNPHARSPAGAQGISQFMPATWATYGKDGDGDGEADIFNPTDAIYSQGVLMCWLIDEVKTYKVQSKISGDPVSLALAAYNAGIGAVLRYEGVPPYRETQAYVKKIPAAARKIELSMTNTDRESSAPQR